MEELEVLNVTDLLDSDINYKVNTTPIDTIITRMETGKFFIPKYQRNYVWTEEKVIALIVSLLKGIPIPRLYIYHDPTNGKNTIIDGQQRLISLFFFVKGIFPISKKNRHYYDFPHITSLLNDYYIEKTSGKSRIKSELKNIYGLKLKEFSYKDYKRNKRISLNYTNFNEVDLLTFENKTLDLGIINIKPNKENNLLKSYTDIFRLLNSGGEPLSNQEIRNGVYYTSKIYKDVNRFNLENEYWCNLKPKDNNRESNVEFLFRLLALEFHFDFDNTHKSIYLKNYKGKYSELIDSYSETLFNSKKAAIISEQAIIDLDKFFKNISNTPGNNKSIEILNFEAFYVAYTKLSKTNRNYSLSFDLVNKLDKPQKSTASTGAVVNRVLSALTILGENYVTTNNIKESNNS